LTGAEYGPCMRACMQKEGTSTEMGDVFRQHFTRNGVKKPLRKWYGEIPDPNGGKPKRVPLSSDKQVARKMLRDLEREAERRRAGLIDPHAESRKVPVGELVAEYLDYLGLKGDGSRHISDTRRLLNATLHECKFATLAYLRADVLDKFLARLGKQGRAARTVNTYRQAAMGFGNWLVRPKRMMPHNPLAESTKAMGEARVRRRALQLGQLRTLLDVARERPLREKMMVRSGRRKGELSAKVRPEVRAKLEQEGRQRVLLYKAAIYTGLRRGELKALRVCHLTLNGETPGLSLPGEVAVHGVRG
jgi:hypothetical protein